MKTSFSYCKGTTNFLQIKQEILEFLLWSYTLFSASAQQKDDIINLNKNLHFVVFFLGLFFVNSFNMCTFASRECVQLRLTHVLWLQLRLSLTIRCSSGSPFFISRKSMCIWLLAPLDQLPRGKQPCLTPATPCRISHGDVFPASRMQCRKSVSPYGFSTPCLHFCM